MPFFYKGNMWVVLTKVPLEKYQDMLCSTMTLYMKTEENINAYMKDCMYKVLQSIIPQVILSDNSIAPL